MAYRLGIDLGTTNTVASIAVDGTPVQLIGLGAHSEQMRSTVFIAEDGRFVVGDAAVDFGTNDPSRLIVDPRRQLGTDVPMIIGGQEVTAEQVTAAVISFVVGRAIAMQHEPPSETVVSHPAHWDEYRIECLDQAIAAADRGSVRLCNDAEAAAATYAARESLSNGQRVVVYDLGGGSCEVTVIENTPAGMRVLGESEGAEHPSGADFDEAVFRLIVNDLGSRGRQLEHGDPDDRLLLAKIKRACTHAKETLSTETEAQVPVSLPGYSTTIRLGRPEFMALVRPVLRDSIAMTTRVLRTAGVRSSDLAAMILVGGCCRMPVVAELLQREFKGRIALGTYPEYDVAIGVLLQHAGEVTAGTHAILPAAAVLPDATAAASVDEAQPVESASVGPSPTVAGSAPTEEAKIDKESPEVEQLESEHLRTAHPHVDQPQAERADVDQAQAAHADVEQREHEHTDADQMRAAADVIASSAEEGATVIDEAPRVWVPTVATEADLPTEQLRAVAPSAASAADHLPVPGSEAPAAIPEDTMPDHLIFDYFSSTTSNEDASVPEEPTSSTAAHMRAGAQPSTAPSPSLPPWAQASAAVRSPGSAAVGSSRSAPSVHQYGVAIAASQHPTAQQPPGSPPHRGPASFPSPGQYPPRQRGPGSPAPWSPAGSPSSPYGPWGGGPGGYPPGSGESEQGPGGSRLKLILIIAGVVVLVGAAVAVGMWWFFIKGGQPGGAASPSIFFTPAGSSAASPTPTASPSATSASPSPSATNSGTPSPSPAQKLPSSAAIPERWVVVPMRISGSDRPLYLVDSEGKLNQVQLQTPEGGNSNPIMQPSRDTIIYLNAGVLRVMAADGSGDRKLFNRNPAGCRRVEHASWSLSDPNVMLISCRVSKNRVSFLLISIDGRLIRRLDPGKGKVDDASLSPDGQTVLYWASRDQNADGGALFTLPIIGTGAPKQLTKPQGATDADPAWSPDGTQIAFRRRVDDGTIGGNEDIFVMSANGSGERAVASTRAADFKPIWSPNSKDLLIVSNRKSDFGGPGRTFDLWLVRASDGEVQGQLGLNAQQITRPFWTLR